MKNRDKQKGALTIEAAISYTIFFMVMVTMLYMMRIVYVYGLIQHAACQTAKELSMYTYVYQVSGINDLRDQVSQGTADRTEQFEADADEVVSFYETISKGELGDGYQGTTDPTEILKNVGSALLNQAGNEVNHQLFELVVRPLMEGYIGADSKGNPADERLRALRVEGGLSGLDLSSSSFFENGADIDLVVCYTVDPLFPIDIMPELHLSNRAYVRGISGKNVFTGESSQGQEKEEKSVWDMSPTERGKVIQQQEKVRNLPDRFPVFSAFDEASGKATAERSIDLRDTSYQDVSKIKNVISSKCRAMEDFETASYGGVTLDQGSIRKKELILYIPSSSEERSIDRTKYDEALKAVQKRYPDIAIITKEID